MIMTEETEVFHGSSNVFADLGIHTEKDNCFIMTSCISCCHCEKAAVSDRLKYAHLFWPHRSSD